MGGSNSRNGIVWNIPDDAQAGNYRVRYIVDVDNAVSESNEANNSSGWVSFTVTVPPSGMISATPCTIPTDSSNCPSTINWTHSNFVGSPVVEQGGTTFSPPATSPVDRPVNEEPGNRTFVLRDNGSTLLQLFAGGTCETGSVWVSSLGPTGLCAKLPSLEILTNPNIIRSVIKPISLLR
ncbi:MAG: CARDB domain-containing protein [Candidatus Paceibacterota bacterium]